MPSMIAAWICISARFAANCKVSATTAGGWRQCGARATCWLAWYDTAQPVLAVVAADRNAGPVLPAAGELARRPGPFADARHFLPACTDQDHSDRLCARGRSCVAGRAAPGG